VTIKAESRGVGKKKKDVCQRIPGIPLTGKERWISQKEGLVNKKKDGIAAWNLATRKKLANTSGSSCNELQNAQRVLLSLAVKRAPAWKKNPEKGGGDLAHHPSSA